MLLLFAVDKDLSFYGAWCLEPLKCLGYPAQRLDLVYERIIKF